MLLALSTTRYAPCAYRPALPALRARTDNRHQHQKSTSTSAGDFTTQGTGALLSYLADSAIEKGYTPASWPPHKTATPTPVEDAAMRCTAAK